jgi:hypothetical protein
LCGKHRKKVMFLSKYSLDRNNTIASLFLTQYTPDFLVAKYYGLRNTIFWVTEDLASVRSNRLQKFPQCKILYCTRIYIFFLKKKMKAACRTCDHVNKNFHWNSL